MSNHLIFPLSNRQSTMVDPITPLIPLIKTKLASLASSSSVKLISTEALKALGGETVKLLLTDIKNFFTRTKKSKTTEQVEEAMDLATANPEKYGHKVQSLLEEAWKDTTMQEQMIALLEQQATKLSNTAKDIEIDESLEADGDVVIGGSIGSNSQEETNQAENIKIKGNVKGKDIIIGGSKS